MRPSEIKGTVALRSAGGFGRLSVQARNGFRRLSAGEIMFLTGILGFAEKMMFARLDFPRFLVCYSGHLSGNKSQEKASVAICDGLSHNLA